MPRIRVQASSYIPASPKTVYAILADYREGHPSILPPEDFSDYEVEAGGVGEGTRIRFAMPGFGNPRHFEMEVTEPEPGRVLRETDRRTGTVTTFTVEPADDPMISRVTMCSEWRRPGVMGLIERWFAKPFLRRIYIEELHRLAETVRARRGELREYQTR
jgi:uncharacterized protein YndB with AHSA1/START domain